MFIKRGRGIMNVTIAVANMGDWNLFVQVSDTFNPTRITFNLHSPTFNLIFKRVISKKPWDEK